MVTIIAAWTRAETVGAAIRWLIEQAWQISTERIPVPAFVVVMLIGILWRFVLIVRHHVKWLCTTRDEGATENVVLRAVLAQARAVPARIACDQEGWYSMRGEKGMSRPFCIKCTIPLRMESQADETYVYKCRKCGLELFWSDQDRGGEFTQVALEEYNALVEKHKLNGPSLVVTPFYKNPDEGETT